MDAHHYVAPAKVEIVDGQGPQDVFTVFTSCDPRTHMAAKQIARHWRACSLNPTYRLCARLMERRTDDSLRREGEQQAAMRMRQGMFKRSWSEWLEV